MPMLRNVFFVLFLFLFLLLFLVYLSFSLQYAESILEYKLYEKVENINADSGVVVTLFSDNSLYEDDTLGY